MTITAKQGELISHGESKKGSEVYYRDSWGCHYFSLLGKCFAMMNDELITLKGDPADNDILRETYEDVVPGYYANKTHWNSIYLKTKALSTADIKQLLDTSYELVFQKLTKKDQATIEESTKKQGNIGE